MQIVLLCQYCDVVNVQPGFNFSDENNLESNYTARSDRGYLLLLLLFLSVSFNDVKCCVLISGSYRMLAALTLATRTEFHAFSLHCFFRMCRS